MLPGPDTDKTNHTFNGNSAIIFFSKKEKEKKPAGVSPIIMLSKVTALLS
jgi:hypothetical protein